MSHEIDNTTGRDAFAYAGQPAWHRLGTQLLPTDSVDEQRRKAGLDWAVREAETYFRRSLGDGNFEFVPFDGKKTLYRSDTGAPLSIMSADDYHPVQPAAIFELYQEIAKAIGATLETAGGLSGGRRIWALLRVNDGAEIVNADRVRPYILLATSYDGTMATIAKFTAIRVVCNNTISMALPETEGGKNWRGHSYERDDTRAGREQIVRILHSTKWTEEVARDVRLKLGIAGDAFERFLVESRALAARDLNDAQADEFVAKLLEPYYRPSTKERARVKSIRDTKGYRRIMELFQGGAHGAEMVGKSRWAMLNAVTEFVDHERGLSDNTRLESAWFGTGNALKERARVLLNADGEVVE